MTNLPEFTKWVALRAQVPKPCITQPPQSLDGSEFTNVESPLQFLWLTDFHKKYTMSGTSFYTDICLYFREQELTAVVKKLDETPATSPSGPMLTPGT